MDIVCVTNDFSNRTLYKLVKLVLGNNIQRDVTARNMTIKANVGGENINVRFLAWGQDEQQFIGLRPDVLVFHCAPPKHFLPFADAVRLTGGLVLTL